jgi:hypothetical protein
MFSETWGNNLYCFSSDIGTVRKNTLDFCMFATLSLDSGIQKSGLVDFVCVNCRDSARLAKGWDINSEGLNRFCVSTAEILRDLCRVSEPRALMA